MLHPDLPKKVLYLVEKETLDSDLQEEIQKKLLKSEITEIKDHYINIIKSRGKIERIISVFGAVLNSKNRIPMLDFFLTTSREDVELWIKEYMKGYREGKLPLDEEFFYLLLKQANTEKLIELILDNSLEKEKIISLLIKFGLSNGKPQLLQYLKLKEPFYGAALKKINLTSKENEKLNLLLQLDPKKADFYSKSMAEFSSGFGMVTLHGGLLYAAEVAQRKKGSSRSAEEQYTFDPTILDPDEFSEYLTILKQANFPIRERFVVTGRHWICGEILVDKGECKILIIDSLGLSEQRGGMGVYGSTEKVIDQCAKIFPSSELYLDATIRQNSANGCSIFALDDVRHLYTVEKYIPEHNLFNYLKKNARKEAREGYIKLTNLPLPFMRTMQSSKLISKDERGVMASRSEREKSIPLGKQKGSAKQYIEEGYKKDFLENPLFIKLSNQRLERKLKKMKNYLDEFLILNLKKDERLEPMMEEFSFKRLHVKLAKKQKIQEYQKKISADPELHGALRKMESLYKIINLLEKGANVNLPNSDGDTPLHIAVQKGAKPEIIQVLLKNGANVNLSNLDGDTPLHTALLTIKETEDEEIPKIITMLLNIEELNVNHINKRGQTPLQLVLQDMGKKGQKIVRLLLEKGAEVNISDTWRELPLGKAMNSSFDQDVILAIIKKTKEVNFGFKDLEGDSILHRVLIDKNYNQNIEIIKELLKKGADVNHQGWGGMTPLHRAIEVDATFPIIQMLLDQDETNVNLPDKRKRTLLEMALVKKNEALIQALLKREANVKFTTSEGNTPLHIALEKELKPEIILNLLEKGADVHLSNSDGITPLQLAFEKGAKPDIIKALLKRGSNVNVRNSSDDTPLHIAVREGAETEIIQDLLENGANVNLPNWRKDTPLHIAIEEWKRFPNILPILLKAKEVNINLKNRKGLTVLSLVFECMGKNGEDIAEKLLKNEGAVFNPTDEDRWGEFPLTKAMNAGVKLDIILSIIEKTNNVKCLFKDLERDSILHMILSDRNYNQNPEITKIIENLFSKGAEVNWIGWKGMTPLHCAIDAQASFPVIQKLLDQGDIDVNITDEQGRTPLEMAVTEKRKDVIEALLDKGANITDAELKKAQESSEEIHQLLLKKGPKTRPRF